MVIISVAFLLCDLDYYHIIIDRFYALDIACTCNPLPGYRYQPLPPGSPWNFQGSGSTVYRYSLYQVLDLLHSIQHTPF